MKSKEMIWPIQTKINLEDISSEINDYARMAFIKMLICDSGEYFKAAELRDWLIQFVKENEL